MKFAPNNACFSSEIHLPGAEHMKKTSDTLDAAGPGCAHWKEIWRFGKQEEVGQYQGGMGVVSPEIILSPLRRPAENDKIVRNDLRYTLSILECVI